MIKISTCYQNLTFPEGEILKTLYMQSLFQAASGLEYGFLSKKTPLT
jgi:hypothetical protein